MFKKMNLPNKITIFRIMLVPVFVIILSIETSLEYIKYIALGVYLLASITDYIDGYIARKKNLITNFGKLMDPLADKILVAAGFIMLVPLGIIPAWITFVMIGRDLFVNTIRMFAKDSGNTMAAGITGKIKTLFQMVGISLGIIATNPIFHFIKNGSRMQTMELVSNVLMSIAIVVALIFTVYSCILYTKNSLKDINVEE